MELLTPLKCCAASHFNTVAEPVAAFVSVVFTQTCFQFRRFNAFYSL